MITTVEMQIVEDAQHGGLTVLRVEGRLDAMAVPALKQQCVKVLQQGRDLVLNLSGVTFISSSGIGALLMINELFDEQGGMVRLAELSSAVRVVVELLELGSRLSIHATEGDAVASVEE